MHLAVTIDVEEEGLFRGVYRRDVTSVENVRSLNRLDSLFRDLVIRPTLLLSYAAVRDPKACEFILKLADRWGAEIGAHLHYWNTPPWGDEQLPGLIPSEHMPTELLREKLAGLLDAFHAMGLQPTSFRMGRFCLGPRMFSVVEQSPILVDSSIAPLRRQYGGPDHMAAPMDPYYPDANDPTKPGASRILEVPITIVPVVKGVGQTLESWEARYPPVRSVTPWIAANLLSIPVQPLWTGLRRMQAATRLHHSRGGRVITTFFHSSELAPGYSPDVPSERDAERIHRRIGDFFTWLREEMAAESVTLTELAAGRRTQD